MTSFLKKGKKAQQRKVIKDIYKEYDKYEFTAEQQFELYNTKKEDMVKVEYNSTELKESLNDTKKVLSILVEKGLIKRKK